MIGKSPLSLERYACSQSIEQDRIFKESVAGDHSMHPDNRLPNLKFDKAGKKLEKVILKIVVICIRESERWGV